MEKLLILADDFTGALDSAVQFAKRGIPAYSTVRPDCDWKEDTYRVISVNANTRHQPPKVAAEQIAKLIGRTEKSGFSFFYKKTDSTLRGNIGAELQAILEALPGNALFFAPAFPANGRITRNGSQFCNGRPIAETVYAKDPQNPVHSSYIPQIIAEQSPVETVCCQGRLKDGADLQEGVIYVFDAESEEELTQIAEQIRERGLGVAAGSAGLAEALAGVLFSAEGELPEAPGKDSRPVFFIGSVNQAAFDQIRYAESMGLPVITLQPDQKFEADYWSGLRLRELSERIRGLLAVERGVVIASVRSREEMEAGDRAAAQRNIPEQQIPQMVTKTFGRIAKALAADAVTDRFAAFGGDTLQGIVRALEVEGIQPLRELCAGTVLSRMDSADRSFLICSKAGGFGAADVMDVILNNL